MKKIKSGNIMESDWQTGHSRLGNIEEKKFKP